MAGRKRRKNRFQFLTKKFPVRMQKKLVLLFMAVILAFLVLVGRITYINVTKGSKYTKLVLNQKIYDSKTILQEIVQEKGIQPVEYILTGESGPDHDKQFTVSVQVNGQVVGNGTGHTKKAAEQAAAYQAIQEKKF